MRTVTFSDETVAKVVNDNFLATWINRNPKFHNCDLSQERRIIADSTECFATKNFCTFFVTPDQEVLHYFSGYYAPKLFLREVEFVKDLAGKVLDQNARFKPDALGLYRALHRGHAYEHELGAKEVRKVKPMRTREAAREIREQGQSRKEYLLEGLRYLDRVHTTLEKKSKNGRLVSLSKVIKNYQGGNEFTEE